MVWVLGFPVLNSTLSYIQSNEIAYYGLFCKLFRAYQFEKVYKNFRKWDKKLTAQNKACMLPDLQPKDSIEIGNTS